MKTATVHYLGQLRTENQHVRSGKTYRTDAPIDNNGKGDAFSPTDLIATGLADCLITIMSMKATSMGYELEGTKLEVEKIMGQSPRRIKEIIIDVYFPKLEISSDDKAILERTATACPVAQSLHPEVIQTIHYHWSIEEK